MASEQEFTFNQERAFTMITWEQYLAYIRDVARVKLAPSNLHDYQYRFGKIYRYFKGIGFNTANCQKFLTECKLQGLSNSSLNNFVKIFHTVDKIQKTRFTADIKYFPKIRVHEIEVLTPGEIKKLAEVRMPYKRNRLLTAEINRRYRAMIYVLSLGLRIGELINLKWEDVHPDYLQIREGKTLSSIRKVAICPKVYKMLMSITRRGKHSVFCSYNGNISAENINEVLRARAKAIGLRKRLHAHIFRHSFITNAIEQGHSIAYIAQHVGHASWDTTREYTHLSLKHTRQLVDTNPLFSTQDLNRKRDLIKSVIDKLNDKRQLEAVYYMLQH